MNNGIRSFEVTSFSLNMQVEIDGVSIGVVINNEDTSFQTKEDLDAFKSTGMDINLFARAIKIRMSGEFENMAYGFDRVNDND